MTEIQNKKELVVILNNIRSNENVGSIFRTCDAVGVSKIILVGITPAPLDRFGRENKGLVKASLGAEKFVPWERAEDLREAVEKLSNFYSELISGSTDIFMLKNSSPSVDEAECSLQSSSQASNKQALLKNWKVIAIEQNENSIDYREIKNNKEENIALVFGNEVEGLSKEDQSLCDLVAEIPMRGQKESLNVAVSVGIVLYGIL
jgi:tRNA G18 (ribose-2'-O)-methylase SpoU